MQQWSAVVCDVIARELTCCKYIDRLELFCVCYHNESCIVLISIVLGKCSIEMENVVPDRARSIVDRSHNLCFFCYTAFSLTHWRMSANHCVVAGRVPCTIIVYGRNPYRRTTYLQWMSLHYWGVGHGDYVPLVLLLVLNRVSTNFPQ